jgi:TRAP-type C4-dicarboxylate transport system permease small subunit
MRTLYARLCAVEGLVAGVFLLLMVALIFLGGVARTLGAPLNWTTDAATCLFAWACFLCADIAWRRNSLMAITLVVDRLPPAARKACDLASHAIIGVFLLYAIGFGTWLAWTSRARSFQGIPEVSYSWVTMSMPVGAALLLVTTILKIRDELRRSRAPGRC